MRKTNPSLVILNGHGSEDCVTGHDNEVLVKAGENEALLKNRITYAVSCDSAEEASARSRSLFIKVFRSLLTSDNIDSDAREDARDILWDMQCQVCLGNGNLTL